MKKYILSSLVVISFISYSVYQRILGVSTPPVIASAKITPTPTQITPTITPAPSPTTAPLIQQPHATVAPTNAPTNTPVPTVASLYKDGTYSGTPADAFYGNIQVQVTISGGKITNVQFLQAPNDRQTSVEINSQADPILAQEAIKAQSAQVDVVSGATDSSQAFVKSMESALTQAKS